VAVANVNGTTIYYEIQGRGMPVIFIHGHGMTHTMFGPQKEYFSARYKVITCDLRGNGKSGRLTEPRQEIIETQCSDLIVLLNQLQIREAVFVGVSYGGLLAQHIAYAYPNRVSAIVVADSFYRDDPSAVVRSLQAAAAYCSCLTYYAPSDWILPSVRLSYQRWEQAYRVIRSNLLEKRPGELYKQRLAMTGVNYGQELKEIGQPALCLASGDSGPNVLYMKELAAMLPQAQFELIPDSLPPGNLCQPELFNRLLAQFLDTLAVQRERRVGG
jgi:pimeloyl-ACP methyl ester carboxylesterase